MSSDNDQMPIHLSQAAQLVRSLRRLKRNKRDFSLLDKQTYEYLQADKQWLQNEIDQAQQAANTARVKNLTRRLKRYHLIGDLLFFQVEQNLSTRLEDITSEKIEIFLNRQRPLSQYVPTKQSYLKRPHDRSKSYEKTELNAFFARAEQKGVIHHNPIAPFIKTSRELAPTHLSFRTVADCQAFEGYLQRRVDNNLFSPHTARIHKRNLRILLHDAELQHESDPSWPVELDGLFADPKWFFELLNNLKNRSSIAKSTELARSSINLYLLTIRHVWLFLKAQKRVEVDFYDKLKNMFKIDGRIMLLPGRSPRIIESLSEAEEEAVFDCITRHSVYPILQSRDRALFITGIETTIRMDGLNSLSIENFRELEPGIHVCRVRIKRSAYKDTHSLDRLADDQAEWRDWYMSPRAISAIGEYLKMTNRDWHSQGPVWLTQEGEPLSVAIQRNAIREWLEIAGCKFTRPHVLRHTGIDRLINKFNKSIPVVQAISQHATPYILLQVYARRARLDAFRMVNQVFPVDTVDEITCQDLIASVGLKLNELSAGISRRSQEKRIFNRQQVEELLDLLSREMNRLAEFLGHSSTSQELILSTQEFQRIVTTLETAGLSVEQILGRSPSALSPTSTKGVGRKPKPLLK